MKKEDIDPTKREAGEYCRKGIPGCLCKVGWPSELQCLDCREGRDRDSFCVCPPKDYKRGYIPEHSYRLTQEQAEFVEDLIETKTHSYRRIADYFSKKYPNSAIAPDNQLDGMELVRLAMLQLDKPLLNFSWRGKRANDNTFDK